MPEDAPTAAELEAATQLTGARFIEQPNADDYAEAKRQSRQYPHGETIPPRPRK